ncbi:MAG: hypothetical protein ACP5HG_01655 [Anaerolineae bacterium]
MSVFKVIAKGAVAFYDELFFYFLVGLVHLVAWGLFAFGLWLYWGMFVNGFTLIHLVAWVLFIPGPFALTAVYVIGQRAVRIKGVNWQLIWERVKAFGPRAWLLFFLVVLGYVVIASNLWFYNSEISPFPQSVATWTTPLFLMLGLLWTGTMFYAQSFLMELVEPTIRTVFRNSLFLTILKPIPTLILIIVSILAFALSVALPILLLVSPGFISALSLSAVRTFVTELSEKYEELEQEDDEAEAAAETESDDDLDEPADGAA